MGKIRHLEPHEWPLLKEFRLKALLSDPQEFSESFDEANRFSDDYWKDLIKEANDSNGSKTFILENNNEIIGFVFGIRRENECRLGGLWIDPACRNQGLSILLINHVKDWSLTFKNDGHLKLWSSIGNLSNFYMKCGFQETEKIKPHPIKNGDIIEMIWQKNTYDLRSSLETDNVWLDSLRREVYKDLFFAT
jgi:GNAT superfamily N-acetyltransferase